MRLVVYLPFLVSALLGLTIPHFGRRLAPATGTRLLVASGAACALSTAFALAALAGTYVGQLPAVAAFGDWSVRLLKANDPVPPLVGQVALGALAVLAVLAAATAVRRGLALTEAARACRGAHPGAGDLIIVRDAVPRARAVPGRRAGRIVVTTGMLRALTAEERRVLLAHERAHLSDRHHLYRLAAAVTAALNPMLAALPRTVEYTTERWADERAAAHVGDRRLAARAVIRAALATSRHAAGPAALAFSDGAVPDRITCLLDAPPRRRPFAVAALVAVLTLCLIAVNEARADTESLFERSEPTTLTSHA
ncbi:M56 family metallopeptidase [Microbispora sp. ATCC PTA-5024]|uniref:M56 family metallopeptidase n=1 Tax=Microbispora sp. ATCC PTA-5024 TaxID=316330 RepID=UPI0003DCE7A2|nr:M56 family metallopeptidase [Microbispora sp. ATCC PTA-5024]ETK37470.1 hypothetical protein MPTA5024_03735 [Microbispora sp. ATCC PTA-5024]